jgi:hypothetical protein
VNPRVAGYIERRGLGEISTSMNYITGRVIEEKTGTSFAAPHISHLAAKLFNEFPSASPDLIRALLVAHANYPGTCVELFNDENSHLTRVCGYGKVQERLLLQSTQNCVTLTAEERIEEKRHHFYQIPIPESFYSSGRRTREVTVCLAYTPPVRTTRVDYKASRIFFKLVEANTLEEVSIRYNAQTPKESYPTIPELSTNRSHSLQTRSKGTVQASTWQFKVVSERRKNQGLFVVVTRNDYPWGNPLTRSEESYALTIVLRDLENENARLYSQIRNMLQIRTRQRVRV